MKNDPLIVYTLDDLFETNPWLREYFKDLEDYEMRAVILRASPYSPYANMLNGEREQAIAEEVIEKPDFEWENYKEHIEKMSNLYPGKARKYLEMWEKDFEDRLIFLSSIPYSLDTPQDLLEMKEKFMKDTDRMWKQYMTCKKDVEAENNVEGLAGAIKSASDGGLI